jgi:hypothetical protein
MNITKYGLLKREAVTFGRQVPGRTFCLDIEEEEDIFIVPQM